MRRQRSLQPQQTATAVGPRLRRKPPLCRPRPRRRRAAPFGTRTGRGAARRRRRPTGRSARTRALGSTDLARARRRRAASKAGAARGPRNRWTEGKARGRQAASVPVGQESRRAAAAAARNRVRARPQQSMRPLPGSRLPAQRGEGTAGQARWRLMAARRGACRALGTPPRAPGTAGGRARTRRASRRPIRGVRRARAGLTRQPCAVAPRRAGTEATGAAGVTGTCSLAVNHRSGRPAGRPREGGWWECRSSEPSMRTQSQLSAGITAASRSHLSELEPAACPVSVTHADVLVWCQRQPNALRLAFACVFAKSVCRFCFL